VDQLAQPSTMFCTRGSPSSTANLEKEKKRKGKTKKKKKKRTREQTDDWSAFDEAIEKKKIRNINGMEGTIQPTASF
jgi:hypothetical protein